MDKYIDRDQLIDWLKTEIKFKDLSDGLGMCLVIMKEDFERAIKHMPDSIIKDVETVKHGRWETANDGTHFCSNCGCDATCTWDDIDQSFINSADDVPDRITNYCPNCGAKMDGGDDE